MNITVRTIGSTFNPERTLAEVTFKDGNATLISGVLNQEEIEDYAVSMIHAFDELMELLPEQIRCEVLTKTIFEYWAEKWADELRTIEEEQQ